MIRSSVIACLLAAFVTAAATAQSSWQVVGQPAVSAGPVTACRIAFDSNNVPYVSYQDLSGNPITARASVKRLVGGTWQYLGGQGQASTGQAYYNQIALDAQNNVYVASRDYGVNGKINVRFFPAAGGSWSSLGVNGLSQGDAHYTALSVRPDGTTFVVYADNTTTPGDKASSKRFSGGSWSYLGSQGFSPAQTAYNSIDVTSNGTPYVAFADMQHFVTNETGKASVMRYDSGSQSWVLVGPSGFTSNGAFNVTIAIDSNNVPWIAYHHYHSRIVVHKWNGTQWVQVGGSASGTDAPDVQEDAWRQWISLCFDSQNTPYVAYQRFNDGLKAAVRKWDGTNWVPVGQLGFSSADADYITLALDGNNVPYVVFRDGAPTGGVATVMRYASSTGPTVANVSPKYGPNTGSNGIVITGSNFTGATSVMFGTNPASFTINSNSQITANLGSTSTTGWVTVSVSGPEGTGSLQNGFDYFLPPSTLGTACGAPTLTWSGEPCVGRTFTTVTQNLGSADQRMLIDWSPLSPPRRFLPAIAQGCNSASCPVFISPDFLQPLGNNATFNFPISDTPSLIGTHVRLQALVSGCPRLSTQAIDILIGP